MGGVAVDLSCRVLDRRGQPIPNLYAVGELAGVGGINGRAALEGTMPHLRLTITSERCNHCDNPPCVTCCPTGASHVHDFGKVVLVDHDKCIAYGDACGYACAEICPSTIIHRVGQSPEPELVEISEPTGA